MHKHGANIHDNAVITKPQAFSFVEYMLSPVHILPLFPAFRIYFLPVVCAFCHLRKHAGGHTCTSFLFWGERVCVSACFHGFRVSGLLLFCLSALSLRRSVFPSLAYFLLVLCSSRTVSTSLVTFLFGLGSHLVGFVISVLLCASEVYAVHYGISYFVVCSHLSDIFLLMLKKSGVSLVVY